MISRRPQVIRHIGQSVSMAAKRDEMTLWTGYFDSRLSRSNGRRVPKQASIPKPTLESVVWAARSAGVRKMRQEPESAIHLGPMLRKAGW